jgi:hypothetical protein
MGGYLLARNQKKPIPGPQEGLQALRIGEVIVICQSEKMIALLLVPAGNGIRGAVPVAVDGVGV